VVGLLLGGGAATGGPDEPGHDVIASVSCNVVIVACDAWLLTATRNLMTAGLMVIGGVGVDIIQQPYRSQTGGGDQAGVGADLVDWRQS
jgi:hypothetical protein